MRSYGKIASTLDALNKLIKKLEDGDKELRFVYEAGPCGYQIYRHLDAKGMQSLYPKLRDADALIIAGPIYWFTVSAQTKIFMDRLYAMQSPDGKFGLAGKQIGILFAYEGSDPFNSGAVNAIRTFQDMFNYIGAEIVGIAYGSALKAGEIKNNQEVMEKAYELGKQLGSTTY